MLDDAPVLLENEQTITKLKNMTTANTNVDDAAEQEQIKNFIQS